MSAGLRVTDAVVTYGAGERRTTAVAGVSLAVSPGEVVALLGPSGCGKSSLLRAVAGLEPLAAGAVAWDDADLAGVPVHRRSFGLMFQDGQLFPHRDVAGNVAYGLPGVRRLPAAARAARVDELLDLVGLTGFGRRAVSTLSGGEAQRVALARSLAPSPRLLLLDEPLSALDRALRESLAPLLRRVLLAAGTTALYVTHDHDEAFTVADRVAVMHRGRLLQVDTPAALWARPRDADVAAFLGYGVVPGGAGRTGDGPSAADAGVVDASDASDAGDDGVALALRPGALRVVPGDASARRTGVVRAVRFRRGAVEAVLDVDGWGEQVAVVPAEIAVHPGDVVTLAVDPGGVLRLPRP